MGRKVFTVVVAVGMPLTIVILVAGRSASWMQDFGKVAAVVWMPLLGAAVVMTALKGGAGAARGWMWAFVTTCIAEAVGITVILIVDETPVTMAWIAASGVLLGYYAYGIGFFLAGRSAAAGQGQPD